VAQRAVGAQRSRDGTFLVTLSLSLPGLKAVGYQYINIDDFWASGRDENGTLVADKSRFPSGMESLTDMSTPRV
jgi:hypothetical protein